MGVKQQKDDSMGIRQREEVREGKGQVEKGRLYVHPNREFFRGHSCRTHCVGDCQKRYEYLIFYHLENYSQSILSEVL